MFEFIISSSFCLLIGMPLAYAVARKICEVLKDV